MRTAILFSLHHFSCRVGARLRACSTSSIGFNLCENCYTCSIFISPTTGTFGVPDEPPGYRANTGSLAGGLPRCKASIRDRQTGRQRKNGRCSTRKCVTCAPQIGHSWRFPLNRKERTSGESRKKNAANRKSTARRRRSCERSATDIRENITVRDMSRCKFTNKEYITDVHVRSGNL